MPDDLCQRLARLEQAGCNEAIVAYADLADLETAAHLLREHDQREFAQPG